MSKLKIFVDGRQIRPGTHFGVSRYVAGVATALAKIHPITLIVCDPKQLTMVPKDIPHVLLNNPTHPSELFIARKLNRLGADVVFTPLQLMGNWGRKYKLIVTMHDTIYYRHRMPPPWLPAYVKAGWRLLYSSYWLQRLVMNMADYVATVSETSRQEIIDLHLTDRPIGIVYNAPDKPAGIKRAAKPKKELVYVGSHMPYKNPETLVRAMNLLPGYTLHLTSPTWPERQAELTKLAKNPKQLKFWNGANERQMYKLLANATAATSSSKAEGFGLPVIEAMSMGTPMICSDLTVFHEVGGKAAIYCDPDSPEQFAAAVRKLENPKIAAKYTKLGLEQAKKFNWDISARQLLKIVNQLVTELASPETIKPETAPSTKRRNPGHP